MNETECEQHGRPKSKGLFWKRTTCYLVISFNSACLGEGVSTMTIYGLDVPPPLHSG
jgi:hypothetical protein